MRIALSIPRPERKSERLPPAKVAKAAKLGLIFSHFSRFSHPPYMKIATELSSEQVSNLWLNAGMSLIRDT